MVKDFFLENNITFSENESLKKHTTFKIGGNAKFIAWPSSEQQAVILLKFLKENNIKYFILGRGSNVIFRDEGFDGVIVKTSSMNNIEIEGDIVYAQSGVLLNSLCKAVQAKSFTGIEFCYGIPGNVGGAVYMNAGAYGGEICQNIIKVRCVDDKFNIVNLDVKDCNFSYRHSIFQENNYLILGCFFQLQQGDGQQILNFMEDIMGRRIDKQPLDKPSAGSSFKRPKGYFAAALIEECGLKGCSVGGAQVSEKHSGFIINKGGATCKDVIELADYVEKVVFEKTGVKIEKEMIIV